MVKLEEVLDEEFVRQQEGEEEWDTDSDSDAESDTSSIAPDETFYDRLSALQDIIPPSYRRTVTSTVSATSSWIQSSIVFGGKALWVVSTSALLIGVPWALAYADDQQMMEMEKEMKMQQGAAELLSGGSEAVKPAL